MKLRKITGIAIAAVLVTGGGVAAVNKLNPQESVQPIETSQALPTEQTENTAPVESNLPSPSPQPSATPAVVASSPSPKPSPKPLPSAVPTFASADEALAAIGIPAPERLLVKSMTTPFAVTRSGIVLDDACRANYYTTVKCLNDYVKSKYGNWTAADIARKSSPSERW